MTRPRLSSLRALTFALTLAALGCGTPDAPGSAQNQSGSIFFPNPNPNHCPSYSTDLWLLFGPSPVSPNIWNGQRGTVVPLPAYGDGYWHPCDETLDIGLPGTSGYDVWGVDDSNTVRWYHANASFSEVCALMDLPDSENKKPNTFCQDHGCQQNPGSEEPMEPPPTCFVLRVGAPAVCAPSDADNHSSVGQFAHLLRYRMAWWNACHPLGPIIFHP
jgi:hypothetical protein